MAPKSALFPLAVLLVLAVVVPKIIAAATPQSHKLGGYQLLPNPKSPAVVAVAKFAMAEHNKLEKKSSLLFVSVVKVEWQVVAGVNYRLVISAKDGAAAAAPKTYTAVVNKNLKGALSLISFQ